MATKRNETTGRFEKVEEPSYGYFSRLLKKDFDTVEELVKAEEEFNKAHEAEIKAKEEKKTKAEAIECAYRNVIEARKDAKRIIEEAQEKASEIIKTAESKYYELRNAFVKEYGSFHSTYTNNNGEETITIGDLFEAANELFKLF